MTERPYIKPQYITQAAEDIGIVARHVMKQPRGYAGFEVERAQVIAQRVDMEALRKTIASVGYVSRHVYADCLTRHEKRVAAAAARLKEVLLMIEYYQSEIQQLLGAA